MHRTALVDQQRHLERGSGPWRDVDFVDVDANSRVRASIGRIDAWLLPFLNVYGFYGSLVNDSGVELNADLPNPLPNLRLTGRGRLRGDVKGWGVTMAGGWKEWFAMGDVNRAFSDLDGPDEIGVSSTMVFHSPHPSHLPDHLVKTDPQAVQEKVVLLFAMFSFYPNFEFGQLGNGPDASGGDILGERKVRRSARQWLRHRAGRVRRTSAVRQGARRGLRKKV